ncbi:peptidoglycan DD-metalloendopeptidase family protein [Enterococcus faecium]|nr:peptidoglycan DD-metalloendopeptidase family protein [Enterococcus faecium]
MKKTRKLLSAILLLGQVFGYTPTVLANEEHSKASAEQSTTVTNGEIINDSLEESEALTENSSENEITDSSMQETQPNETETNNSTTDSSEENDLDSDKQISENKPIETPTQSSKPSLSKPSDSNSTNQENPQNHVEISPVDPDKSTVSSSTMDSQVPSGNGDLAKTDIQQPDSQENTISYHQPPTSPIKNLVPSSNESYDGDIHFEKNESVESFIRKIGESARKVGQKNDLYASVMIAQAILESASGQSKLAQAPNYNLFGIKGTYNGNSVSFVTQEDLGEGVLYTTQATFRKYKNYEDSLADYAKLLKEGLTGNSNFYDGVWKTNTKNYQEATRFLTGKYATDTKYDQKLNGLIETYNLTEYDQEVTDPKLNNKGYIVPLKNYTISSLFGKREGEFHRGLDLAAAQGEPIYASKTGTVIKAEFHPSWGNYVAIEHEDGTTALYAHQQEYQVEVGDHIKQGQIIGFVGSTGNSTGSHLHFELCIDNTLVQAQLIDPKTVLF